MSTPIQASQAVSPPVYQSDHRDWKYCGMLVGILTVLYLVLQNGYWVSGPDVALYISVARNLIQGHGFLSNGCAVGSITPGWPFVLSAVMRISSSFAVLNLIPMLCLVASSATWYWIIRRLAGPMRSLLIVLLFGTLFWTYSATNQLRSEGLFCLCLSSAVLLACQMAEGRGFWVRLVPLLLLCIAIVTVRFAGVAAWCLVGAAVMGGQRRFVWNRAWICLLLIIFAFGCGFLGNRYLVKNTLRPPDALNPTVDDSLDASDDAPPQVIPKNFVAYFARQTLNAGKWMTGLFWMPSSIAASSKTLGAVADMIGWGLLALLAIFVFHAGRYRQYLMLGGLLYSITIILRWGRAEPRYLMPVAPLLIAGVWLALDHLAAIARSAGQARLARLAAMFFVGSMALSSAVAFTVDAYIARSGRFYHYYLGGELEDLIRSAAYLNTQQLGKNDIAVSAQYLNMGLARNNGFGRRGISLLTDKVIRVPKGNLAKSVMGRPNKQIITWANNRGIKFYVYRPEVSPWRAWHFRVPWLQKMLTGKPVIENAGWELYRIEEGKATQIPLAPAPNWPRRVPGL